MENAHGNTDLDSLTGREFHDAGRHFHYRCFKGGNADDAVRQGDYL